MNQNSFIYEAYGLSVLMPLKSSLLQHISIDGAPDLIVTRCHTAIPPKQDIYHEIFQGNGEMPALTFGSSGDQLVATFKGGLSFSLSRDGKKAEIRANDFFSDTEIEAVFLSQIFPLILSLRGFTVLHASAVRRGDKAIGFIGNQGEGKSTIAAAFIRCGYQLVTDDVLVIEPSGNECRVRMGPPEVRLTPSAFSEFSLNLPGTLNNTSLFSKTRVTLRSQAASKPFPIKHYPIDHLFLITEHDAPQPEIQPLKGARAIESLLSCSLRIDLLNEKFLLRELHQLQEILTRIPLLQLAYRREFSVFESLVYLVERHRAMSERVNRDEGYERHVIG